MVSPSSRIVTLMTSALGGRAATRCRNGVHRRMTELADHTDEEIQQECRTLLSTPKLVTSRWPNHVGSLGRLAGYELMPADERALAAAAEAFTRFPPGTIPRGTTLFDQQIQAAVQLVRGALVQMDTGEGKTYAIMIAAFALLRRFPKVYVLTANPYLALRDAGDTVRFWSRIGIRVGVATPDEYEAGDWPGWDADVVYSTAEAFGIQSLRDDLFPSAAERRIQRNVAVILDEADAVLLEQISQRFQLTRDTTVTTKDWDTASAVARRLDEEHVSVAESLELGVVLTPAGEAEVRRLHGDQRNDLERLSMLRDVELAYTALRLAVPGLHYELTEGGPVALEQSSGWRTASRRPDWMAPLAHDVRARQVMHTQIVNIGDGLGLLGTVPHLCGTSGTVVDEALEYMLLLGVPTVAIPPRAPRFDATVRDVFCLDDKALREHLLHHVRELALQRPMMIVSSSIPEAKSVADFLAAHAPPGVEIRFASGERIAEERLFEDAGRPGVVIVSTRVAGRGVDVRLSDEARANGGMVLISIGHGLDGRLDRQLLGRVGRQGDEFTAWFVNHPNDMLTREVSNTTATKAIMNGIGVSEFESGIYRRALAGAQRTRRQLRLQDFASEVARGSVDHGVYEVLGAWCRLAQAGGTDSALSGEFPGMLAQRYLADQFPGVDDRLTEPQAGLIEHRLLSLGCVLTGERSLRTRLVGQQVADGLRLATEVLAANLRTAVADNAAALREAEALGVQRIRAVADLAALHELRGRIDESGAFGSDHRVALVHDAAQPDAAVPWANTVSLSGSNFLELRFPAEGDVYRLLSIVDPGDPWLGTDDAMNAVFTAVEQLDDLPTWTGVDRLVARLRWVEQARVATTAVVVREYPIARHAKNVVLETVCAAADLLDRARERALFALNQRQVGRLRYQTHYVAMCDDLRRQIESHLVETLCRNLITAADPGRLDDLFQHAESTVPLTSFTIRLVWIGQEHAFEEPVIVAPRGITTDELIEMYLLAQDQRAPGRRGRRATRAEILPAISATLADSPLSTLADPLRVREALERWRSHPLRAELTPWRRRTIDRYVQDFLGFLNDQGVAAALPTGPLAVSRAWLARAASRVKSPQVAIGLVLLVLVAGIAPLLAVDLGLSTSEPGPALGFVDHLLSGGLLGGGHVLGAALLAITGAALAMSLLSRAEAARGVLPVERLISLLLAVFGAAVLAGPWWGRSFGGVLNGILVALAVLAVSLVFRKIVWTAERLTQIRLVAGLLGCLAALTVLWIGGHGAPWPAFPLAIAATVVAMFVLTRVRQARLPVNALRTSHSRGSAPAIVPTTRAIATQVSWRVYGSALAAVWLLHWALPPDVRPSPFAVGGLMLLYLGIVLAWARTLSASTTNPDIWQHSLRRADQSYRGSTVRPTLDDGLSALRRRLLAGEVLAGLVVVAVAVAFQLMADDRVRDAFPAGLTVATLMLTSYELLRQFFSSVGWIFFGVASPTSSAAEDNLSGSIMADARDLLLRLRKRLVIVLAVIVILSKTAEILDIWEVIQSIGKWVASVF